MNGKKAQQFRNWLTLCINCARSVPDALDPKAASILENVRNEFDRIAALAQPTPTAAHNELLAWCAAYPVRAFPEPDLGKAAEVLKAAGMTLDAISAFNFRHVLKRVEEICRAALNPPSNEGMER